MCTALMKGALRSVTCQTIAEPILTTILIMTDFFDGLNDSSIEESIEFLGLKSCLPIDAWTLPDALWLAFISRKPELNYYPMGEITERTVKKTVANLIAKTDSEDIQNSQNIKNRMCDFWQKRGRRELLKKLLTEYFFEIFMDQLRRTNNNFQIDFGYRYNFDKHHCFVSLKGENKLRGILREQCREKVSLIIQNLVKKDSGGKIELTKTKFTKAVSKVFGQPYFELNQFDKINKSKMNVILPTLSQKKLRHNYDIDQRPLRLCLHKPYANVLFSFDNLSGAVDEGKNLNSHVKDLLDIGASVYMSDLYIGRYPSLKRHIGLLMPVRHPAFWEEVKEELEMAVSSLARDEFVVEFVRTKDRTDKEFKFSPASDSSCVCLLSGGLDSLAGAIWILEKKTDSPVCESFFKS